MVKSADKAQIQNVSYARIQQELQVLRQQLLAQWKQKLQVDRHRLDVEEEILQLQAQKEKLEQMIYEQSAQTSGGNVSQWTKKIVANTETVEQPIPEIPPDCQTPPVTLSRIADAIGGDMTRHKLRKAIDRGTYRAIQINRQSWIFDRRQLAECVVEKLRR